MRRVGFVMAVVCLGALSVSPPARQAFGQDPDKARAGGEFPGKFVLVNIRTGAGPKHAVVENIVTRRIGNREFLTGEYVLPDGGPAQADWKGAVLVVPVDNIETLMVFADKDKALRVSGGVVLPPAVGEPK